MRNVLTAILLFVGSPIIAGEILIEDAYVRAARPGAPTGAIFFTIRNESQTDDRLVSVRTPVAQMAELHTHIEEAGILRMRQVERGWEIPAGGSHELGRGADHVMLMGVTESLETGGTVALTLTFEKTGEIEVVVEIDNERGQVSHSRKKLGGSDG